MASGFVLALQRFFSSGVTSSTPYNSSKGMKFVALETEVL
jgi:hypothetical protein